MNRTHQHRRFDPALVTGGILWSLLGLLLVVLFITLPDRPYAPAIFLGIAVVFMGLCLAWPTRRDCHRAEHYPHHPDKGL